MQFVQVAEKSNYQLPVFPETPCNKGQCLLHKKMTNIRTRMYNFVYRSHMRYYSSVKTLCCCTAGISKKSGFCVREMPLKSIYFSNSV